MLLLDDVLNILYFLQLDHFSNVLWNLAALLQQTGGENSLVGSSRVRRFEKRFIKDISCRLVSNAGTVRENFPKDENFT